MESESIMADACKAACDFHRRKLWKRFTNYDCFGVRIAGRDDLILGVVLGDAGEEHGLSLFRGPNAAACLGALLEPEGPGDDALEDMDTLGFSMEAFGTLPPDAQTLLRDGGRHPQYREAVPHFLAKPAGQNSRLPNESELRELGMIVHAVVQADKEKLLHPACLDDPQGICVLNLSNGPAEPEVRLTREVVEQHRPPVAVPLLPACHDLDRLPRLKTTWLVGLPALPAAIEGDDRAMQVLLVVDDTHDLILHGLPVFSGDLREAANGLVKTFQGKGLRKVKGLPAEIAFSSRKLFDAMAPVLEPLGVRCRYEPAVPKLQQLMTEFYDLADRQGGAFDDADLPDAADVPVPAPQDLKGWKQAQERLCRRCADEFHSSRSLQSSRAVEWYFGDNDFDYYVQEHREQGVLAAYIGWAIVDYRPNKTSKTHAEKMLKKGLGEAEAILLRAQMETCPTLYRVARHNAKAGTVELEDILLGGRVTVHDQLMSENIENNLFLPARVFPAGAYHFLEPAGPLLGAGMGLEAVEFLRECGMELTEAGLRRHAHLFGWLWEWMEEWQADGGQPRMCNTDGDELLWHTASFSVAAPDEVRKVLLEREDIEYDRDADEFVWSRPAGRNRKVPGDTVALGRIELVGDELVLEVNSARRLDGARQWLEKLPGVVFRNVTTRRWDEVDRDRPLDERISSPEPVEMTPELSAAVQEMMNKHYMSWLDEPLPALGGKTPQQACRTAAGRRQVLTLIRTMPDPAGPVPIRAPREALMQALGLTAEAGGPPAGEPTPAIPIPIESIAPKPRIARNAPCPCGSGRKYKKCCGREPADN